MSMPKAPEDVATAMAHAAHAGPAVGDISSPLLTYSKAPKSPGSSELDFSSQIDLVARQQEIIKLVETPQNPSRVDDDELTALRKANAALSARLRILEGETPEEREARKLKAKNAGIEELKASHERIVTDTEEVKKKLAERHAYLRDVKAQIAKLQLPLPFAVKEKKQRRKGKGRQARDDGEEGGA